MNGNQKNIADIGHILNKEEYKKWELVRKAPHTYPDYAPFGQQMGKDPSDESQRKLLPIQGPTAMHQIWSFDLIGSEWKRKPENKMEGLLKDQWERIETDLIRGVESIRFLGKGGWGQVFEVTAELFSQTTEQWTRFRLACKVIRHEKATYKAIDTSFSDYKILRYLRHENICNLAEIGGIPDPETGFPYAIICLFLEYCDGDLQNLYTEAQQQHIGKQYGTGEFERWILPVNLSKHWFAQIARALDYLHSNGVAHQDMKLANILYRYVNPISDSYEDRFMSATFKLTDFGNAQAQFIESKPHLSRYDSDINWLYVLWYTIGIPAPKKCIKDPLQFANKCKSKEFEPNEPDQWVNPDMIDLISKIGVPANRLTASQILLHPWLQNNEEPRTELFIYRPDFDIYPKFKLQPHLYPDWEKQSEDPGLYEDYAPFGQWSKRHRQWDQESQTWILPIYNIQGPPKKADLMEHGLWTDG